MRNKTVERSYRYLTQIYLYEILFEEHAVHTQAHKRRKNVDYPPVRSLRPSILLVIKVET